ncbi:uncharacterized protein UTRI_05280 [Ustilago trichophora]|uniref:Large ribosomal subunit protein mL59 domain-containing protein n=1 Tax=Ustilago trichophora TaxID=86804 RepID=A0A5C3EJ82_9BASI|nr:uncharacterized protein UTRI_05280 [Ustilago trichophora]
MAFRTTVALRGANKHLSAYGTVLDRFMVSNTASLTTTSSSSSASSSSQTTAAASLFEPTKSETTGCWHPPKYSLRRQAKLVREAALTGQLALLPDGPKTTRMTQRLHRLQKSHAFEQSASEYQYIPKDPSVEPTKGTRPEKLGQRTIKPTQRISSEEKAAALNAARLQVKDVGPYAGRAKVFKGSRVDKGKAKREGDVKTKLGGMEQTVSDWHSTQNEARNKLKPGLPF